MRYIISIPEVWWNDVAVEAESKDEAREKAERGEYESLDNTEYGMTLYEGEAYFPEWLFIGQCSEG